MERNSKPILKVNFGGRVLTPEEIESEISEIERLNELPVECKGCTHRYVDAWQSFYRVREIGGTGWSREGESGMGEYLGAFKYRKGTLEKIL